MKFEKSESSPCVVSLKVTTDAEEIKGTYQKVLNTFVREASVPGFRKGKTPVAIIKQKFADGIKQEVQQACFHEFYPQAVKESGVEVLQLQNVVDVTFSLESGFAFTALVEVPPVFSLPKYKKLSIKGGDLNVTDDEVTTEVERYRRAFAKFNEAKPEDVINEGAFVQFDYSGTLDDKAKTPLSEVVPEEKAACGAEGFWTQVEEGRFLPEILEALKGMKTGETKESIKVKFPKEGAPEALKGKKALYKVTVKAVRLREMPNDEDFLKSANKASMDELRNEIRGYIEQSKKQADQQKRESEMAELLLKKADFAVPPSMVQNAMQNYLQNLAKEYERQGMTSEYLEKNREQILKDAEEAATKQVRMSYILEGIAKEEKLEVSEEEILKDLEEVAKGRNDGKNASDLLAMLKENNQVEQYKEHLLAKKAVQFVLDQAK